MDLNIADKSFLVVGGTSGMGLATARVLAEEGAQVVISGRDQARADRLAGAIAAATGSPVSALTGDVSQAGMAEDLVGRAVGIMGQLDGLCILTGIIGHEPPNTDAARWAEVLADGVTGITTTVMAALPHLMERGGTIVTTSAYSIRAPEIERIPYTSAKAAVAVFTKAIAKEYGKHGVRANCVCPGAIETEPMAALRPLLAAQHGWPEDEAIERVMVEEWGLHVALGRPGKPREVGELMAFLLSPMAGYVTGTLINIDGGTNF